jgi:polyhydroxyalkanoate synthesis regulator phasin
MDKEGDIRFWEYRGSDRNTEMTEGSLVYLGAQYGMAVKSAEGEKDAGAEDVPPEQIEEKTEGGIAMKGLLKLLSKLFPGKSFTEEGIVEEIREAFEEMKQKAAEALSQVKEALKTRTAELEASQAKIKELSPLAADGKAFRDDLVSKYAANKAKLGEVAETPEAQDAVKKVAADYPIEFLRSEVTHLQKRVEEKFPDKPQLKGDDRKDKSGDKKNPLIPNEEDQ